MRDNDTPEPLLRSRNKKPIKTNKDKLAELREIKKMELEQKKLELEELKLNKKIEEENKKIESIKKNPLSNPLSSSYQDEQEDADDENEIDLLFGRGSSRGFGSNRGRRFF